ncbi:MAG: hypothetical protein LBF02_01560 [Mycoplasmataceae bacterium]|jgi:predicted RNA-binding protein with RPS1 domain|nr:hypothetical protein [Mycoplasmataceae bacterium]
MEILESGKIYECLVKKITKTYIIVECKKQLGIVHISEISDYLVKNIADFFQLNRYYEFLLIEKKGRENIFSYKRIYPKLLKKRSYIIPTKSGFDNIYKLTLQKMAN